MRCQRSEVHPQHVGLDDVELRVRAQAHGQVAVQFDDGEPAQALDQGLGQRGQPGADLDHGVAWFGRYRLDDAVDDAAVAQKVLAETFARLVLHRGGSRYST